MSYYLEAGLVIGIQLLPFMIGLRRWHILDRGSRVIAVLAGIGSLTELLATISAIAFGNNLAVYNIASLVIVLVLIYYFRCIMRYVAVTHLDLMLFVVTVCLWLYSNHKGLSRFNTGFTDFEVILTMIFSMVFIYTLIRSGIELLHSPHFWFAVLLLLGWCLNLVQWNMYDYLTGRDPAAMPAINLILTVINMAFNVGFALVFHFYPRLKYGAAR